MTVATFLRHMRRLVTRLLLAVVVLPHELAHAAPARLAGLQIDVTLRPEWAGPEQPLGQFDAEIGPATPLWLIRMIAVAPLIVYVGAAAGLGAALPTNTPVSTVLIPALAYWATLSNGDIAVAVNARSARETGAFRAPRLSWGDPFALAIVPLTVVLVALLLVG